MAKKRSSKKEAPTTTSFAKMGTEASRARVATGSDGLSPNVKFVRRANSKSSDMTATKSNRVGQQERLGFQGAPQVNMVSPNNAESASEGRNVRLVPSAVGNRDFYLKRAFGQTGNFG